MPTALYHAFLGTWTLDTDTCEYEQGAIPREGNCRIEESEGELRFIMRWVDEKGHEELLTLSSTPNGLAMPFDGGALADAISTTAVSERELNTSAYYQGRELMIAQRQLDASGSAMRITQIVRFLDGSSLANVGLYRKNATA